MIDRVDFLTGSIARRLQGWGCDRRNDCPLAQKKLHYYQVGRSPQLMMESICDASPGFRPLHTAWAALCARHSAVRSQRCASKRTSSAATAPARVRGRGLDACFFFASPHCSMCPAFYMRTAAACLLCMHAYVRTCTCVVPSRSSAAVAAALCEPGSGSRCLGMDHS